MSTRQTFKQWRESGLEFSKFAAVGDEVDEELFMYFIAVLPPATCTGSYMQVGEPYSQNEHGDTFTTFEKNNGV